MDIESGTPLSEVGIDEDRVRITTDYPLVVSKGEFTFVFPKFYTQVNYKLGKLYETAKEIMESENEERFLEEKTIDFLVLYEDIPFSGTEMTCDTKLWTKPQVRESLKEVLAVNIPEIKVKGADNDFADKYDRWETKADPDGIDVRLRYFESWPIAMDVFPSEGDVLRADQLNENLGNEAVAFLTTFFCITNYNFVYDIKYPVLIELADENGFTFQFATQVIVDNNQPRENELGDFEVIETEKRICNSASMPTTITVMAEMPGGSLQEVEDAQVKYKCINEVCELGVTEGEGGRARLFALLPACVNGLLTAQKEGMHKGQEIITTTEPGSATVILDPYYELDFDVVVVQGGIERALRDTEQLTLYLEEEDKDYQTNLIGTQDKVKLISGDYNIRAFLVEESPFKIKIQGKDVESCVKAPRGILGIFGFEEEKCSTTEIPDMELSTLVKGGGETTWRVTSSELGSANKVTFYVKAERTPTDYDELTELFGKVESQAIPEPRLE